MPKYIVSLFAVITFSCAAFSQNIYHQDFLEFWNDYNDNYAYFERQGIDWQKVKSIYLPATDNIKNDYEFTCLLESVVNEFHNGHVSLNRNYTTSNRIIPSGADVFATKDGRKYFITDVKEGSRAKTAGMQAGMEVVAFNGKPVEEQLHRFLPKYTENHNEAMYTYAVNMLFAGTHDTEREFTVLENGIGNKIYPDKKAHNPVSQNLLDYKILKGNIGYIRINNSLGNNDLIKVFDAALDTLMSTKSLILDLTDTPGGGNTTVARGILGRFIERELPYQKHLIEEKQYGTVRSWTEYANPRGKPYNKKLVVMVGHWTGSMGEGIAIGFDAMKRAKITGTRMAGLLGAIYTFSTANTKIGYQIPCEKLYHVNGTLREDFLPPYITQNSEDTFRKAVELAN